LTPRFLQELYHQDHGFSKLTTILFSEKSPSDSLKIYLRQIYFGQRVVILEGNPLVFSNLFRASVESNKCSIILADKETQNPTEEDQKVDCDKPDNHAVLCIEEFPKKALYNQLSSMHPAAEARK